MKKLIFIPVLLLLITSNYSEASDWREDLRKPLVEIQDGKFVYEKLRLCGEGTNSKQVKLYSEVPTGVMSRDGFVAFSVVVTRNLETQMFPSNKGSNHSMCKDLSSAIGDLDIEVSFYMTGDGFKMQIQDYDKGKRTAVTKLWKDLDEE